MHIKVCHLVHYDTKVLYVCAREYGDIIKVNFDVPNTESLWYRVHVSGRYPTLSKLARALLSVPISNADCERIFFLSQP